MRRDNRKYGRSPREFNNNFSQGPREMHNAKCAECGAECQVPFQPREGRPVYCRECFQKNRSY